MRPALTVAIVVLTVVVAGALYKTGLIRFNYPSRTEFPIRGIDVSHHQGIVDWKAVRNGGYRFAFIKASEGGDHTDRQFQRNWAEGARRGMARGAYHFFTFCSPGALQSRHFLATVGSSTGELPLVADVEFSGNCTRWKSIEAIRSELRVFLEAIEEADQRRPIIYYTGDAYSQILELHFDDYPRWPRDIFFQPKGDWMFWQFADNGRVDGIGTLVDLNVFRGSADAFEHLMARHPN